MTIALQFLAAFLVAAGLVPVVRSLAFRAGLIAQPREDQFQSRAVALFGGIALSLSVLATALAFGLWSEVPVLLACGIAIACVGAVQEVTGARPYVKLVAQIVLASILLAFDYRLHWTESITLDSILSVFWIVGVTSAFNLLDNMDGLCGGIALIAGTAFLLSVLPGASGTRLAEAQYLVLLLGATAAFLIYNVHPASIAMGDSGSLLIGFNMAAIALRTAPGSGSDLISVVAVPVLVLLIPIADAALVAGSRLVSGRLTAGNERDQSSHRLVAIGLSERTAVGVLWALAAVSGAIGVAAGRPDIALTPVLGALFIIGLAIFAVYLFRVQVYENPDSTSVPGKVTPLVVEFVARRRIAEVLLDVGLVSVAYYGAYRLRFEGVQYAPNFEYFLQSFPVVVGAQIAALLAVGAYRGTWRYFSLADGVIFLKGVVLGAVAAQAVLLLVSDSGAYSQAVFVVYGMLLLLMLVGSRASFRLLSEFVQRRRHAGRRLVFYGAGDKGAIAVRRVLHDPASPFRILGFIDDDPAKRNVRVHGFNVLGGYDHLVEMIMAGMVDAVAITAPRSDTEALERLCARYGVTLYRARFDWLELPGAPDMTAGGRPRVSIVEPHTEPGDRLTGETVIRHAFSVDVEDWYHGIPVETALKDSAAPRLERGLHILLDLLAEHGARATFFILGPLVEKHPAVIRRIADEGHELGCHGWSHDLVYETTPAVFAADTQRAQQEISQLTGHPVLAFRAPYFSITRESLWALEVLADLGFRYDSSIFPVRNWRYGIADFSRDPVLIETPSGPLWEFPISVMERYGQTIPVSGGAYFRLYPYSLTRSNFKAQERMGRSAIFYLHPWELDPHHPQVSFAWKPRLTHYANLQSTRHKLVRLLRDFHFGSIGDVIAARV